MIRDDVMMDDDTLALVITHSSDISRKIELLHLQRKYFTQPNKAFCSVPMHKFSLTLISRAKYKEPEKHALDCTRRPSWLRKVDVDRLAR